MTSYRALCNLRTGMCTSLVSKAKCYPIKMSICELPFLSDRREFIDAFPKTSD